MYSERDPPCETDSQSDALDGKCVQLNVTVEFGSIIDIIIDIVILTHSVIVIIIDSLIYIIDILIDIIINIAF